jgi:hypothetical protein
MQGSMVGLIEDTVLQTLEELCSGRRRDHIAQ